MTELLNLIGQLAELAIGAALVVGFYAFIIWARDWERRKHEREQSRDRTQSDQGPLAEG